MPWKIVRGQLVKARAMTMNTAHSVNTSLSRRKLLIGSCAAAYAGASLAQSLPEASAEVWADAARGRQVPVLLRWPAGKPQGVMVYSHGLGGKKEGGDYWGQAWAQAGLLVVHLQHIGSDAASLKGGFAALRKAMQPEQMLARIADVRFAVAEIHRLRASAANAWGSVPVERLAIGGHSFGARTAMVAAGWRRNGVGGNEPLAKAFVAMSPAVGKDVSLAQAKKELAGVTRPFLVCTGSLDGEILNNGETPESRRMVFDAIAAPKKALLWLDQADHFTFAGNQKLIPSTFLVRRSKETLAMEEAHHERVARVSAAWLREQLLGQPMGAVAGLSNGDQWIKG
jgi:predicted dienelactone hydrolase